MEPNFKRTLVYEHSGEKRELQCIIAIIQDAETKEILMHGFIDRIAWQEMQETKMVYLWSTSEDKLWRKGATTNSEMQVVYRLLDCDCDAVIIGVKIQGNGTACHTGKKSCFYNEVL